MSKKETRMNERKFKLVEKFHNSVDLALKSKEEENFYINLSAEIAQQIGIELNSEIVNFASELSSFCAVPDNDTGPFDSKFCSDLENLIVNALMRNFHE